MGAPPGGDDATSAPRLESKLVQGERFTDASLA